MELFGLDFPAVEKPDDDDFDNEHDMIPDDSDDELGNEDDLNDALGCVDSDEEENWWVGYGIRGDASRRMRSPWHGIHIGRRLQGKYVSGTDTNAGIVTPSIRWK